jgi:hypothetical protein
MAAKRATAGGEIAPGASYYSQQARGAPGSSGWRGIESLGLPGPDRGRIGATWLQSSPH